ncbi:hypothetical protein E2C01_086525 [Portunus trituberculatus]|uniref:Uncharacterized protein n=1 Tax=Portunus trituberculatus TaxID=210409 RepID=A0A5B7J9X5_PORTR|nr:hypothetical protein [Portunus trituberculatus]
MNQNASPPRLVLLSVLLRESAGLPDVPLIPVLMCSPSALLNSPPTPHCNSNSYLAKESLRI